MKYWFPPITRLKSLKDNQGELSPVAFRVNGLVSMTLGVRRSGLEVSHTDGDSQFQIYEHKLRCQESALNSTTKSESDSTTEAPSSDGPDFSSALSDTKVRMTIFTQ